MDMTARCKPSLGTACGTNIWQWKCAQMTLNSYPRPHMTKYVM
nr:MAG TPA: hypothetical protein [Bacteriophage sp.]